MSVEYIKFKLPGILKRGVVKDGKLTRIMLTSVA